MGKKGPSRIIGFMRRISKRSVFRRVAPGSSSPPNDPEVQELLEEIVRKHNLIKFPEAEA